MTEIRKPDPDRNRAAPKPRPMTPEVILRTLGQIMVGDIELATTDGRRLLFRRVVRPNAEQKRILDAPGIRTARPPQPRPCFVVKTFSYKCGFPRESALPTPPSAQSGLTPGGQALHRTAETEQKDTDTLRRLFGVAVVETQVNPKIGKTHHRTVAQRSLRIPF